MGHKPLHFQLQRGFFPSFTCSNSSSKSVECTEIKPFTNQHTKSNQIPNQPKEIVLHLLNTDYKAAPQFHVFFFFFFFLNKGFNSGKQKLYSSPGKKSIAWRWYCLRSSTLLRQHLFNNTSAGISHRGHQHLTGNDCNTLRITGSTSHPRKQKCWAFTSALAT